MKLYQTKKSHALNNECFRMFAKRYSWVKFTQPQPEKAPWHLRCEVRGEGPYPCTINFWPHVGKAQREGENAVQGWDNIRALMTAVIEENGYDTGPELIE